MLLSLDLGTTTGWAVSDQKNNSIKKSGSKNFKPTKFESHGHRYVKFKKFLEEAHTTHQIAFVSYEEVRRHIGTDAAHMYGGFLATLQQWCIEKNIAYSAVPVKTIKKFITGNGNASKQDVIDSVKIKLGIYPVDDNEADAVALASYSLKNF